MPITGSLSLLIYIDWALELQIILCESFYKYVFHSNTVESDLVHVYIYLYLARQVDETLLSRLYLWTIVSANGPSLWP
jgi:hypothetical protein